MREEFVDNWKRAKSSSPKLEFYNQVKDRFEPENYLDLVNSTEARKSLTRYRISAHNLYIERGRYETPLVPREDRWCVCCFFNLGIKVVEDELHVLTKCPLYTSLKNKFNFSPPDIDDLVKSLSIKSTNAPWINSIANTIHAILTTNNGYTNYYKSMDFHSKTGACVTM